MNVSQLKRSISEIDYKECVALILAIRANRRISKRPAKQTSKQTSTKISSIKRPTRQTTSLERLQPQLLDKLIETLEGMVKK